MKKYNIVMIRNSGDMMLSKFVLHYLLVLLILPVPIMTAFASTESSISEVQRLLSLINSSLLRDDLDGSIESLNEALSMVQELKEEEEEENTINNNNNGVSNGLEDPQEDERGNNDNSNDDTDDSDMGGGGIVDDNVERSQECIKNAKPGEVCAL
jgi:hypothetical protein